MANTHSFPIGALVKQKAGVPGTGMCSKWFSELLRHTVLEVFVSQTFAVSLVDFKEYQNKGQQSRGILVWGIPISQGRMKFLTVEMKKEGGTTLVVNHLPWDIYLVTLCHWREPSKLHHRNISASSLSSCSSSISLSPSSSSVSYFLSSYSSSPHFPSVHPYCLQQLKQFLLMPAISRSSGSVSFQSLSKVYTISSVSLWQLAD